jgi:hypothetical protein
MLYGETASGDPYHSPLRAIRAPMFFCAHLFVTPGSVFRVESGLTWARWLIVPDTVEPHGAVQQPGAVVRNGWCVEIAAFRVPVPCVNTLPSSQGCTCANGRRIARQSHGAPVLGGESLNKALT